MKKYMKIANNTFKESNYLETLENEKKNYLFILILEWLHCQETGHRMG